MGLRIVSHKETPLSAAESLTPRLEVKTKLSLRDFTHDIEFSTGAELVVLFGPSGAGKSLTLDVIAGLIRPDSGYIRAADRIFFDSAARIHLPPQKRGVGYVFQDYALFPHLSVAGNIAFGLSGASRQEKNERVTEMLNLMRLDRLGDSYPDRISGGQRQRVALARALITRPAILLLDEPFSALDSAVREKLRLDLIKIKERYAVPILFVTHDLEEAYQLADRIVVLDKGHVLQDGCRDDVFRKPANRTVARFVGAKNIFTGEVAAVGNGLVTVKTERFDVRLPCDKPLRIGQGVNFCVRPEDIMIIRPDRVLGEPVNMNVYKGAIVAESHRGTNCNLQFRIGGVSLDGAYDFTIRIPAHSHQRLRLNQNREVAVSLKKSGVHLFEAEEND